MCIRDSVDTAPRHLGRVVDVQPVPGRRIDGDTVGGRIHHDSVETITDDVRAVVGGRGILAHRRRHRLDDLAVLRDGDGLGVVIGGGDELATDRELGLHVLLAEETVTQIDPVSVDRDIDLGAGLPELRRAPT